MKRHFIILAAIVSLVTPAVCMATPPTPGPYASGFIGVSIPKNADVTGFDYFIGRSFSERVEFDPGINFGGTVGYDYGIIRLEGEVSYKHGEIVTISDRAGRYQYRDVDGSLGVAALMFNAFLDLHNPSPVTPYLGGGVGFADLHITDTFVPGDPLPVYQQDDDSAFAYQVGAGVAIALNQRLSLDLGYRYFGTSTARFGASRFIAADLKFQSHNTTAGLRVKF